MIQTLTFNDFCNAFRDMGRNDSFTYNGKQALFEWLEEYEECSEKPMELDVIALDCEFREYGTLEELQEDYTDIKDMDDLRDHTTVLEFDGGLIVGSF